MQGNDIGSIRMKMHDNTIRTITGVRYVPSMTRSLLSIGKFSSLGCKVLFVDNEVRITRGAMVIMKGRLAPNNLSILLGQTVNGTACVGVESSKCLDVTRLWHLRFGHTSEKTLDILHKRKLIFGNKQKILDFCQECVQGKQTRVSFGVGKHTTKGILDCVHSNVWGPTSISSIGGGHYFISFIDDFSRKVWVYVMKHKSESFDKFKVWLAVVENQTGKKLKVLRSDNGGEYKDTEFLNFCSSKGIQRHFTTPGDPESNGVAKRMNITLLEKARCMRLTSGLSKGFWAEAVSTSVHIINRIPCLALNGKIPEEVWRNSKSVCLSYLRIFGCLVFAHQTGKDKLDPRAICGVLFGYTKGVKGYRIWVPETKKIIHSRHVIFDESFLFKAPYVPAVESSSTTT